MLVAPPSLTTLSYPVLFYSTLWHNFPSDGIEHRHPFPVRLPLSCLSFPLPFPSSLPHMYACSLSLSLSPSLLLSFTCGPYKQAFMPFFVFFASPVLVSLLPSLLSYVYARVHQANDTPKKALSLPLSLSRALLFSSVYVVQSHLDTSPSHR